MDEWLKELAVGLEPLIHAAAELAPPNSPLVQIAVAGSALLLVLILARTPSRHAAARLFLLLAAGVAALGLWLGTARLLPEVAWVSAVVWPTGLLLIGGLLGKMALANRYAALRDARHSRSRVDSQPLPFQRRALDHLREQAECAPTPLAVGLHAEWGMGKSIVMEHLLDELNQSDRFVAVKLNVWEYEDHGDQQYGAMQALLAHPRVLEGHGWLAYPLWMLAREWGGLNFRSFRFGWGKNEADADGRLHLPWQARFERIVARQHLVGRRVVFVLDEIDRASAVATQGALTLISRSLALPGVVVATSYVEDIIRFKAFHPDMVILDDLRDTVSGYLHHQWLESLKTVDANPSRQDPRRHYASSIAGSFNVQAAAFMELATPTDWSDYYKKMTERYLSHSVYLGRPDGYDLVALLQLPEVSRLFAGFGEARYQEMLAWVERETTRGNANFRRIEMRVRWLKGDLLKLLSMPIADGLDPRFCLMLALNRGGAELKVTG